MLYSVIIPQTENFHCLTTLAWMLMKNHDYWNLPLLKKDKRSGWYIQQRWEQYNPSPISSCGPFWPWQISSIYISFLLNGIWRSEDAGTIKNQKTKVWEKGSREEKPTLHNYSFRLIGSPPKKLTLLSLSSTNVSRPPMYIRSSKEVTNVDVSVEEERSNTVMMKNNEKERQKQ